MGKKIIGIMLFGLLFLTGCTAEYTLDIDNEYLYQEITTVSAEKSPEAIEKVTWAMIEPQISIYEDSFDKKYYQQSDLSDEQNSRIKFFYKYNAETYPKSMALHMCYDVHGMVVEPNTVLLQTDEKFKCMDVFPDLTKVTVKINCPFEVVKHNADSVDHETYTWVITRENAENRPIMLKFNKTKEVQTKKESNDQLLDMILIGIGCFFLVVVVIYLLGVYSKNQNNNNV